MKLIEGACFVMAWVQDNTPSGTSEQLAESGKSLFEYLSNSGAVGVVLLLLSIWAVALVILHMNALRRSKLAPESVVEGLGRMLREGDWDSALLSCRAPENDCYLTRVFASAIARAGKSSIGMFEMRKALEDAGQRETEKLYRHTDLIGLIAALGPMLGLLGTVFGMIGAFGSISELEGAARSRELASFMAMALVNTAQGLAVAIPCTAAFSLFRRRIERLVTEVAEVSEQLIALTTPGTRSQTSVRTPIKSVSSESIPPRS